MKYIVFHIMKTIVVHICFIYKCFDYSNPLSSTGFLQIMHACKQIFYIQSLQQHFYAEKSRINSRTEH